MNAILIEPKGNTQMIAHRGLSALERENTVAAFVAAGNRSYFGIETDIHRTADGPFAVIHDDRTGRVSPVDLPVEESPMDDLRRLELYDTHGLPTRGDLVIPTLEEYAAVCRDYGKVSVLELKSHFTPDEIARIVSVLRMRDQLEHTIFISFDIENLYLIRKILPDHPVQFLTGTLSEEIYGNLVSRRMDLDVHFAALTKEWVDRYHAAGLKINCWTVDNPDDCRRLIDWGVDYITSNRLE
ncbi:MAG: glycerophosphodiester phosphodiesterase family protein [Eubacteriales bacterium]